MKKERPDIAKLKACALPRAGVRLAVIEGACTWALGQLTERLKVPVPEIGVTVTETAAVSPVFTCAVAVPVPISVPPALRALTTIVQVPKAKAFSVTPAPVEVAVKVALFGPVPVIVKLAAFMSRVGVRVFELILLLSEMLSFPVVPEGVKGESQDVRPITISVTKMIPMER